MSLLTAPQQTELEKPVTRTAYFLELQFSGGTSRMTTFNKNIDWGGHTWYGLGQLLRLSQVVEAEGAQPRSVTAGISAAQAEWLAVAIGPVEEYRGLPARLYMGPMDASYSLVGTPALAWRGIMDTASIGINGDEGGVEIKCETAAYALKRRPALRMNAAQHKRRYPGETGFDYLTDLIANPARWLSKRFMAVA